MLKDCEFNGRKLNFFPNAEAFNEKNKFTVVIGKNGTGKSRLLRAIIEKFVKFEESELRERSYSGSQWPKNQMVISCETIPKRVIALSTSPFDRFPIRRGLNEIKDEGYQYLGLRGLGSNNLSLSFMSRTLGALLSSVTFNTNQAITIQTALEYLGYEGFLEARFVCSLPSSKLDDFLDSSDPVEWIKSTNRFIGGNRYDRFHLNFSRLSESELAIVLDAMGKWRAKKIKPRVYLRIDKNGVKDVDFGEDFDSSLLPLFKLGFFQLIDIGLQKKGYEPLIRINDASSGEQCVVMALLGIASHIQNGSLICIDEPEICLHPEWQERYIELLTTAFDQFSNCHFIIATHSPQVVAKLQDKNCFVLDLESGITKMASEVNGRSADFQLARVFNAPGFKNEYLNRILFNALRLIGSGQALPVEQQDEIDSVIKLKNLLSDDDPVKSLMDILEVTLKDLKTS